MITGRIRTLDELNALAARGREALYPTKPKILVGAATCGEAAGAREVIEAIREEIANGGFDYEVAETGCIGWCSQEPLVDVLIPGKPRISYGRVTPERVREIVRDLPTPRPEWAVGLMAGDENTLLGEYTAYATNGAGTLDGVKDYKELELFKNQLRIVMRNCGIIDPASLEQYVARGGYLALYKALRVGTPEGVLDQVMASGLRGRGGAGFPTGAKWKLVREAKGAPKYVICNADEGDPGAYMDRGVLEGDPHSVLEGMAIGGYAMGATEGILYVREEYPLAVTRMHEAIAQAEAAGLLGNDIFGTAVTFKVRVVKGAGAFVCGEETALIRSIEGRAGEPSGKPPFPAQRGLWGKPTCINNVETWANVPVIVTRGSHWFASIGTEKSKGTKVFSLVGNVNNTALIEVPMGTKLSDIVYRIGGGIPGRGSCKAIQTGGPSGGCIPAKEFDLPVDYESLANAGTIMGSGGMIVMDDAACMVDIAKYFLGFLEDESCGKCFSCREGTQRLKAIVGAISEGRGKLADLELLQDCAWMVKEASLCGLGQTAPNPVLSTLRHFRHEFEDHIVDHRCSAGVCQELAVSPCENSCPLHMNIPRFLELYKEGRLEDAFESVLLDNPLPASTGRVCQQHCESRCRRTQVDEAVNAREVHRFLADSVLLTPRFEAFARRIEARRLPLTGRKAAIVGAGPAGLAAAFYLSMLGHDVTVYDARPAPGGMLRFAIPEYRLPKDVLEREVDMIRRAGVKFVLDTRVGHDVTVKELRAAFDAVLLSTGTWQESWVRVPGTELKGVYPALPLLEQVSLGEPVSLGRKVAVIGGGNAAVDAARTALRAGAEVTVVYRRERKDMPAIPEEVQAAEDEGVKFIFLAAPHRIVGERQVVALEYARTKLGDYDGSGRRKPILTDEVARLDCDAVILAVGEAVEEQFACGTGLALSTSGTFAVDRFTLETSAKRVYASGDAVAGASTVSNAMAYGKRAARSIDLELMGLHRWDLLFPNLPISQVVPETPSELRRHNAPALPVEVRIQGEQEVVRGLTADECLDEANRCLRCDVKTAAAV